ncbi:hypothetical protein HYT56_03640 [Candidatus Woesearchaeota archaeon]|nr:hypothetical protein [Candidatus Woesearchaeota archaeon]
MLDEISVGKRLLQDHPEAREIFAKVYDLLYYSIDNFSRVNLSDLEEVLSSQGEVSPGDVGNPELFLKSITEDKKVNPLVHLSSSLDGLFQIADYMIVSNPICLLGEKREKAGIRNPLRGYLMNSIIALERFAPEAHLYQGTMPIFIEGIEKVMSMFKRDNFPFY